jgi:DNA polymerase-3 subunit delta
LDRGLESGLRGGTEGDLVELAAMLEGGLPAGHSLVLAESVVAEDHPLVEALRRNGAYLELSKVEAGRGGSWQGLAPLVRELEEQTGVSIAGDALEELGRRTLQRQRGRGQLAAADSTARFAGEYRKLAGMMDGDRIERRLVEEVVEDRGEEDVWEVLNTIGNGDGAGALERFQRMLAGAEDPTAVRLSFFALLADFSRHLLLVAGRLRAGDAPPGERHYGRFKSRIAPALQEELPGGLENPLAKLHPYRLHRSYLAASRLGDRDLSTLPWELLQTELRLKGESGNPDAALAALIALLSGSSD